MAQFLVSIAQKDGEYVIQDPNSPPLVPEEEVRRVRCQSTAGGAAGQARGLPGKPDEGLPDKPGEGLPDKPEGPEPKRDEDEEEDEDEEKQPVGGRGRGPSPGRGRR